MIPKDIAYFILAGFTILGNIATVLYFVYGAKFKLNALETKVGKIYDILYPENGRLQFQTIDDCASCRKSCRDDICGFVKDEMSKYGKTITRIHERLDEQSKMVNSIAIWMPKDLQKGPTDYDKRL